MTYSKQTWSDAPATSSPINAARLNHMEDGIAAAALAVDLDNTFGIATGAASAASAAQGTANNAIPKTADITAIVKIVQATYDSMKTAGTLVGTTLYIVVP